MLLSILHNFTEFQPSVAYESVDCKKACISLYHSHRLKEIVACNHLRIEKTLLHLLKFKTFHKQIQIYANIQNNSKDHQFLLIPKILVLDSIILVQLKYWELT